MVANILGSFVSCGVIFYLSSRSSLYGVLIHNEVVKNDPVDFYLLGS